MFCRYCACKGGHQYDFKVEIDIEKVEKMFGREIAEKIKAECGWYS